MGTAWRAHFTLDWTLQALRDHPGVGADLILVGLRSPVVRNRNMALMALKHWPRNTWPATAPDLITDLARRDPNEHAKELAAELSAHAATGPAPDDARDE